MNASGTNTASRAITVQYSGTSGKQPKVMRKVTLRATP